jgi:hypothetical protein
MILCDSCGRPADPQHIRERIERLELATRFRPVHIRVLLIDAAPPLRPDDYFYRATKDGYVRFEAARAYFDRLVNYTGSQRASGTVTEEAALSNSSARDFFLRTPSNARLKTCLDYRAS